MEKPAKGKKAPIKKIDKNVDPKQAKANALTCLLYTSPSPRD